MDSHIDKPAYTPPDSDVKDVMAKRLEELEKKISSARGELERLEEQVAAAERERDALQNVLSIWNQEGGEVRSSADNGAAALAADGGPLPTEASDLVVKLLEEMGRPLHFREIEKELRARNWYVAGGGDPANTLLAKYFNDERLYRPSRGVYALRPEGKTVRSVGARRKGRRTKGGR